jgi:16S rRNA processing protein RimM
VDARSPTSQAEPREAIGARSDRLVVGLVRGVHGLRGVVRVEVLTDRPEERYGPGSVLHREGSDQPLTVVASTAVADGPGWRLQFAEVPDRGAAESLMGAYLEIDAGPDAVLPRGAYYWHEVIGTSVVSTTGEALGTVRDVYRSGGAEVYIVDGGPYGEFDVPGVRDFVRIFAPRRGEIVVDVEALDLIAPRRRGAAGADAGGERPRAPRRRPGSRRRSRGGQPSAEAGTNEGRDGGVDTTTADQGASGDAA